MKISVKNLLAASGAVVALCSVQPGFAATRVLVGSTFDVSYDDLLTGLFGAPELIGNALIFTPPSFLATSSNNLGYKLATSTINLKILPHAGQTLASVTLTEVGDYMLSGSASFVSATGQLRSLSLANPDLATEITSFLTASPMTLKDGQLHNWSGSAGLDYTANPQVDVSQGVNLTVQNNLGAYTQITDPANRLAFIQKKAEGGAVTLTVTMVPEAQSYALMLAGLGLVGWALRRRAA